MKPWQPHQEKRFDPEGLKQMQGARLVYGVLAVYKKSVKSTTG
ncbi:hypothetical protein [Ekhidna sp.]